MRIYRGKEIATREWKCGQLIENVGPLGQRKAFIAPLVYPAFYTGDGRYEIGGFFQVELNTVGEFTGMVDKNGGGIFEGDFLLIHDAEKDWISVCMRSTDNPPYNFCLMHKNIIKLLSDYSSRQIEILGNNYSK